MFEVRKIGNNFQINLDDEHFEALCDAVSNGSIMFQTTYINCFSADEVLVDNIKYIDECLQNTYLKRHRK